MPPSKAPVPEISHKEALDILKAYRNFPAIVSSLRRSGRLESGLMASHVEQPEERLAPVTTVAAEEGTPPYMSLILSRKK